MTSDPGVVLRPLREADAEAIAVLHVEVWEQAYGGLMPGSVFDERRATLPERVEHWRAISETSPARTTVAERDRRVVGFASVGPSRDDDVAVAEELWALYVHRDLWGAGIGHRLVVHGLADRPAYLWVLEGNERAIAFYRRHGFLVDGTVRTDELGTELRMVRTGGQR